MATKTTGRSPGVPTSTGSTASGRKAAAAKAALRSAKIDPRIRERRITVRRDAGRRRLRRIVGFVATALFIAATVAAFRSPLLDIDHVEVRGATHTSPAAILAAGRVRMGEYMIDVDVDAIARRVAAVPTVGDVAVRRRWPGTVSIEVTERRPLTQIRTPDGAWVAIDDRGRLLKRMSAPASGLLVIEGSVQGPLGAGVGPLGQSAVALANALRDPLRAEVESITQGPDGAGLRLVGGTVVELGDDRSRTMKLLALRALLAQPDRRCFATIRLGVPTAPALTRLPGCA